jgi:hypothetical protein
MVEKKCAKKEEQETSSKNKIVVEHDPNEPLASLLPTARREREDLTTQR